MNNHSIRIGVSTPPKKRDFFPKNYLSIYIDFQCEQGHLISLNVTRFLCDFFPTKGQVRVQISFNLEEGKVERANLLPFIQA